MKAMLLERRRIECGRCRASNVGNEGGGSGGVVVEKRKLAEGWLEALAGKRGTRASLELHPTVPSKEKIKMHSALRDYTRLHGDGGCRQVATQNCTLSRAEAKVMRGAEVTKPRHDRGASLRSHMPASAP